eukprot:311367-Rhodomonas_salina.1
MKRRVPVEVGGVDLRASTQEFPQGSDFSSGRYALACSHDMQRHLGRGLGGGVDADQATARDQGA